MACPNTSCLDSPVTSGLWLTQMRLVLRSLSRPGVMAAVGTLDAMDDEGCCSMFTRVQAACWPCGGYAACAQCLAGRAHSNTQPRPPTFCNQVALRRGAKQEVGALPHIACAIHPPRLRHTVVCKTGHDIATARVHSGTGVFAMDFCKSGTAAAMQACSHSLSHTRHATCHVVARLPTHHQTWTQTAVGQPWPAAPAQCLH